jgi:hypothetical protein
VPLLAFFYLLTVEGLGNIWELVVQRNPFSWRKRVSGTLAVLLVLGILYTSSYVGEYGLYLQKFDAARATYAREAMGTWLRANVAPKTLIAVDAAGQVPYFSQLPAIDMFGINDVHIARLRVETLGQGTPGHEKFDLGYVLARQPQYVVIYGAMFDAIAEYERWDVAWTQDASLKEFLTLYRRK